MPEPAEDIYRALADPSRRQIISALCDGPMVAGELGRLVGLAPNAVSFHLKLLRSAGLVSVRRKGRFLRYEANASALTEWQAEIRRLFVGRMAERLAARRPGPDQTQARDLEPPPVDRQDPRSDQQDDLPTELL